MQNETREKFEQYTEQIEKLNGIRNAAQQFTAAPSVQQTLETKVQESSSFLQRINMPGVIEKSAEKLGLGIGGPIASTTNTVTTDRTPVDPTTLDADSYECTQTNSDTVIRYAKLDTWAQFPDFQTLIRDAIIQRQALDRIMIGWNGVSRAPTSNIVLNPLLQDVNVGWLQKYRSYAPARVMKEVQAGSNKIKVGPSVLMAEGYKNLDALVFDLIENLIDIHYRQDPQLVVVLGSALLADKYFPLINTNHAPTETLALDIVISQKRIGGKQAVTVPYFPPNALLITRLDNLSVYWQRQGRRRSIIDNPKRDRIENYESSNDAYVIEDYAAGCFAENLELVE